MDDLVPLCLGQRSHEMGIREVQVKDTLLLFLTFINVLNFPNSCSNFGNFYIFLRIYFSYVFNLL